MIDPWYTLQLIVALLCALSWWSIRWAGPDANRRVRWLGMASIGLLAVPWPAHTPARLVPLQADHTLAPAQHAVVELIRPDAPLRVAFEGLGTLLIASALVVFALQVARVATLCARAEPRLRVGSVTVATAPVPSPRTLWLLRHWVLLDPATAADPSARDLAVRHELQHIRHGDTRWSWAIALLTAVCAPNPFAWLLARHLGELDEHAVDHALIHRRAISPRAYGRLLLQTASAPTAPLALTAGLSPRSPLHRRLRMLDSTRPNRVLPWVLGSFLVAGVALARPTLPIATDLHAAIEATNTNGIEVRATPMVEASFDRLTRGTGSRFFERALARRPDHAAFIAKALDDAGLPHRLEAIALIESGYDDRAQTGDLDSAAPAGGPIGAGLWMFIPSTAREYGLRVDEKVDERLDRELETQAAIALLTDLHDRYGDWGLALAAYNQGPRAVDAAIEGNGTRDALELAERGALNRYVPMVYAAMLALEAR